MIFADVGTVSYNGYTFDGASHINIRCEPVYDDAERTVIYHRYIVNVKSIVANSVSTGAELSTIRALLTKARGILRIEDKGFGSLTVNDGVADCDFGPKPRMVSWRPIGSLLAAEIEWECVTTIPYCSSPLTVNYLLAFNFGVSYSLDEFGLTTRTITGYLEIGITPVGRNFTQTADTYRHVITPTIPERFKRISQNFQLSLDKRRLDFTIVDQEIRSDNPYPSGVINIDAKHRATWSKGGASSYHLWNTISVDVELAPNQEMLSAYWVFYQIAITRINIAKSHVGNRIFLYNVSAEEDIFGWNAKFSCRYRVLESLSSILTTNGLFTPMAFNSWPAWAASIANITDVRGYANLAYDPSTDVIFDTCGGSYTPTEDMEYMEDGLPAVGSSGLTNQKPDPDKSWLDYKSRSVYMRDQPVATHRILQPPDADDPASYVDDTIVAYEPGSGHSDIIQKGAQGSLTLRLVGKAERAGHQIPKPAVIAAGGATAKETGGQFTHELFGNALGVPVFRAAWAIDYALDKGPGVVTPPPNQDQGVATDGTADQPTGYP